jgi:hypothetical protein
MQSPDTSTKELQKTQIISSIIAAAISFEVLAEDLKTKVRSATRSTSLQQRTLTAEEMRTIVNLVPEHARQIMLSVLSE